MDYNKILDDMGLMALPKFSTEMVSAYPDQTADLLNQYRERFRALIEWLNDGIKDLEGRVDDLENS